MPSGLRVQTPYYLYVVDRARRLIGVVGLRDLVISAPETIGESFMNPNVIPVTTHTDQEDVARLMARYDLAGLPVVDDLGILQGVVAVSFFIPLIIGTGGNAGSQSVTTVIRGLALQEIRPKDVSRVVLREIRTSALLGLLLGLVALRMDPTVMSAPLIATLVDAAGLLIYMSIAGLVIRRI